MSKSQRCCCPCTPCICCDPDFLETGTGSYAEGQSGTGTGAQVLVSCPEGEFIYTPCCPLCLPCVLCLYIDSDTCVGTCAVVGPGAADSPPRVTLTFDRCFVDERTNERVWQWTNLDGDIIVCDPAGALGLQEWTINKIYFQCRENIGTRATRLYIESPDQTYCDQGGGCVEGFTGELFDLEWILVTEECEPLYVEFTGVLLPGFAFPPSGCGPCAGCFVTVHVEPCEEGSDCGCDPQLPSTLYAWIDDIAPAPACNQCTASSTPGMGRVAYRLSLATPDSTRSYWGDEPVWRYEPFIPPSPLQNCCIRRIEFACRNGRGSPPEHGCQYYILRVWWRNNGTDLEETDIDGLPVILHDTCFNQNAHVPSFSGPCVCDPLFWEAVMSFSGSSPGCPGCYSPFCVMRWRVGTTAPYPLAP